MESKWTLEITQDHIDSAVHHNSLKWSIALALRDKGFDYYSVGIPYIYFNRNNDRYYSSDDVILYQKNLMSGISQDPITLEFDNNRRTVEIIDC